METFFMAFSLSVDTDEQFARFGLGRIDGKTELGASRNLTGFL